MSWLRSNRNRCISFDSYIKPQPSGTIYLPLLRCISFDSYIKPQPRPHAKWNSSVVYLLIPTSNHNNKAFHIDIEKLYIFWFLHQTTTLVLSILSVARCISFDSYIKPQLILYHKKSLTSCISFDSYIKPQLRLRKHLPSPRCISFDSYIKPQLPSEFDCSHCVVYLLIPTSNHNLSLFNLYLSALYIFWFLHQTTTDLTSDISRMSCISFDSYIKPQPSARALCQGYVVYLLIPTSNHNLYVTFPIMTMVVYLLIPTSNHNSVLDPSFDDALYIFWFLHQTTTNL